MEQLRPPKQIEWEAKDLQKEWKQWKEEFSLYIDLCMGDKEDKIKVKMLMYLVGPQGRELYETIKPARTQREDGTLQEITLEQALQAFNDHCQPARNETIDRYKFFTRNQESGETFDGFLTELKLLAADCNFGELKDSLIRDRIICGIRDPMLRERLLRENALDLTKCVKACQASVLSKARVDVLQKEQEVYAVQQQTTRQQAMIDCNFCGYRHAAWKGRCPALDKECFLCHKTGHFANKCRMAQQGHEQRGKKNHKKERKPVNAVGLEGGDSSTSGDEEYEDIHIMELQPDEVIAEEVLRVENTEFPTKVFATMTVNGQLVKFQIDSGATCNIIPKKHVKDVEETTHVLAMYNQTTVKPIGKAKVKVVNPRNGKKYRMDFIVLEDGIPIIGSRAAQQMGLITICKENVMKVDDNETVPLSKEKLLEIYSDVFEGTGKFEGKYHMEVDDDATPVIHPPRRVPVALRSKLKEELDRLVEAEIIAPVETHTPWVSSLVCVEKPNGKMRVCLDPRDLNKGLKRSHYPMTTIEDILTDLNDAKVFSTFDAKNGFWHVELDEDSAMLTTFNTPYGRYRWRRMPFGLSTAPEEFQRRQNQMLEGLDGVRCVADDILVYGKGRTIEAAEKDHDRKVNALMERCRERNLKLNIEKTKLKVKESLS